MGWACAPCPPPPPPLDPRCRVKDAKIKQILSVCAASQQANDDNVVLVVGLARWVYIKPTLAQRLVFAGARLVLV